MIRRRTDTGSSYNFATENDINVISAQIGVQIDVTQPGSNNNFLRQTVSVAKLLQLPCWGTVSISGLHMMLLSDIGLCRFRWMWIGSVRKHCLWYHLDVAFRRSYKYSRPTSVIRPPSRNFCVKESSGDAGIYTSENVPKHRYGHWDCIEVQDAR